MKKVSVILTTYNSEKFIKNTINSIKQQEGLGLLFDLELIAVDDFSTDNTLNILKSFDIKCIQNEKNSGGPNYGRNIALKQISGDFFCIADHDDEWKKDKIIMLLPYLEKVPIVSSGYTVIDNYSNKIIERKGESSSGYLYFKKNETFLKILSKSSNRQNIYLGSLIFKKELANIMFEEYFGMIDFDWVLKIFHHNDSIEVTKSLYIRKVEKDNLSLNETYRMKDFYFSLMTIETYEHQYPKIVRNTYYKIHGSRARYYYLIGNMKKARFYFLKSKINILTIAYILTSFIGHSFIRKRFNLFG